MERLPGLVTNSESWAPPQSESASQGRACDASLRLTRSVSLGLNGHVPSDQKFCASGVVNSASAHHLPGKGVCRKHAGLGLGLSLPVPPYQEGGRWVLVQVA